MKKFIRSKSLLVKDGQLVKFLYTDSFGQIETSPKKGNEWW